MVFEFTGVTPRFRFAERMFSRLFAYQQKDMQGLSPCMIALTPDLKGQMVSYYNIIFVKKQGYFRFFAKKEEFEEFPEE